MARPAKTNVDYFPHMTHSGKTIAILEARWGNDGYAFWFKLLELLGDSQDFSFHCSRPADWEYLLSKTRVTEPMAQAILDKLAEIDAIDTECWLQKNVWSDNFVRNLEPVFEKRKRVAPQKPQFLAQKPGVAEVSGDCCGRNSAKPVLIPTKTDKVKQSKPNESKGEQSEANETEPKEPDEPDEPEKPCPSALRPGAVQQADTVFLTTSELAKLQQEFGEAGTQRIIELLDSYKTNNPERSAKYRDDFKVIRSWVIRRYQEETAAPGLIRSTGRASPAATIRQKTFIDKLADMAVEGGL